MKNASSYISHRQPAGQTNHAMWKANSAAQHRPTGLLWLLLPCCPPTLTAGRDKEGLGSAFSLLGTVCVGLIPSRSNWLPGSEGLWRSV